MNLILTQSVWNNVLEGFKVILSASLSIKALINKPFKLCVVYSIMHKNKISWKFILNFNYNSEQFSFLFKLKIIFLIKPRVDGYKSFKI